MDYKYYNFEVLVVNHLTILYFHLIVELKYIYYFCDWGSYEPLTSVQQCHPGVSPREISFDVQVCDIKGRAETWISSDNNFVGLFKTNWEIQSSVPFQIVQAFDCCGYI